MTVTEDIARRRGRSTPIRVAPEASKDWRPGSQTPASATVVHRSVGKNIDLLRFNVFLFVLPNALFATWLGVVPALAILVGCFLALRLLWRAEPGKQGSLLAEPVDLKMFTGCAALAIALCLLGGEAHVFYANLDWLVRDAVLSDLVGNDYPVIYRYEDHDYLLRAPLATYVAPSLFGKILGLQAAHLALLAQDAMLLTTILYFVGQLARPRALLAFVLVVGFSGLDIIPTLVIEVIRHAGEGAWPPIDHIEWWNPFVQYSSHITHLFWAPNHALPGWQLGVLTLLYARREIDLATTLAILAPLVFWSPLATLGAAPIFALFCIERAPGELLVKRNIMAALSGLCFVPIAYFIILDAGENPHRLLMTLDGYPVLYGLFLLVEIPHAWVVVACWRETEPCDRRPLVASLITLALLPMYQFGWSNDLAMRASIMPMFLLAFAFVRVAASLLRRWTKLSAATAAIIVVSAATPGLEIARAFKPAFAVSDCNFLTAWRRASPGSNSANYLARVDEIPDWLVSTKGPRIAIEARRCWPDHPVLRN
jgi:hypothetical protein